MIKYGKSLAAMMLSLLLLLACLVLPNGGPFATEVKAAEGDAFTVTFDANGGGTFDGGGTTNVVKYESLTDVKYSHTSNVDDTGLKTTNYGNNWTNSNIRGTDRTEASSEAHVLTIDGATSLTVELYYNGENTSYDWVSVWSGSHPTYTASNNATSAGYVTTSNGAPNNSNKFGGTQSGTYTVNGNRLTSMGHVTLTIPGDTVTFGFKSDSSGYGAGYGYYAIVTASIKTLEGSYQEPVVGADQPEHTIFVGWNTAADGSGTAVSDEVAVAALSSDTTLYAQYNQAPVASGTWWKLYGDGALVLIGSDDPNAPFTMPMNNGAPPWNGYDTQIKSVTTEGYLKSNSYLSYMFEGSTNLETVDLSGIVDTSSATTLARMFYGCTSLKSVNLSHFDVSHVTNMYGVFYNCPALESVNIGTWQYDSATTISSMFYNCDALTSSPIPTNTSFPALTDMSSLFSSADGLTSIDVSGWQTPSLTTTANTFYNCANLTEVIGVRNWDVSKVTNASYMFASDPKLTSLDLHDMTWSALTNASYMFQYSKFSGSLNVNNWNAPLLTNASYMFRGVEVPSLTLSGWNTPALQNMSYMFSAMQNISSLDVSDLDTGTVTNMSYTFYQTSGLSHIVGLDHFDTRSVTTMTYMFQYCAALQELDGISGWNVANLKDMSYMFQSTAALQSLDLSSWSTPSLTNLMRTFANSTGLQTVLFGPDWDGTNITTMYGMFYGCSKLESLDLSDVHTSTTCTNYNGMFQYCSALKELDISGLVTSHITGSGALQSFFGNMGSGSNLKLERVKLGSDWRFRGTGTMGASYGAVLPTPPSAYGVNGLTDGKWAWEGDLETGYTPVELRDTAYDGSRPGWYVWHRDQSRGVVIFDPNGGTWMTSNWSAWVQNVWTVGWRHSAAEGTSIYIPGVNDITKYHEILVGWTTQNPNEQAGRSAPEVITETGVNRDDILENGQEVTYYAMWEETNLRTYTVYAYFQNSSLTGYEGPMTMEYMAPYGETVEAEFEDMTEFGFKSPTPQTVTVAEDDSSFVEYYYDRYTYSVVFDPNGEGVTGEMPVQTVGAGAPVKLNANAYEKEGSLFVGWNTKPDGSGKSYKDGGTVVQMVTEDGTSITLYAQWEELGNITFVDGEARFTVRCKANETIVIPDLPAGVTYEIREIGMQPGWQLVEQEQTEGTIYSVVGAMAGFMNVYNAEGSGTIDIYKYVIDSMTGQPLSFDEGDFEFALLYEPQIELAKANMLRALSDTLQQLEVQTNGPIDTEEFLYDEDGNATPNPYYGMSKVSFGPFDMSFWEMLENGVSDFTFWIAEINVPAGYEADESIEVHVHIEDAGSGLLTYTVTYWRDGEQIEPIFVNRDTNGEAVQIIKNIAGEGPADAEFTFKVDVFEADGKTYHGVLNAVKYTGDSEDGELFTLESGSTVTMRADQRIVVRIPDGLTYEITENEQDGWVLTSVTNNKGVAVNGEQTDVVFTNAYEVNGLLDLNIHKILEGRDLVDGEFNFELVDENGELVGMTSNDAQGDAKIQVAYSTDDIGKTFNYILREVVTEADTGNGITYDTADRAVTVVVGSENGEMTFAVTVDGAEQDPVIFTNSYNATTEVVLNGTKVLDGREFREGDEWTFDVTPVDGGPEAESVVIHPYADGQNFEVKIGFTTADMGGATEKEFTYNITESGHVALVANDKTVWTVKIKVTDNGNGLMRAEVIEGETEMTFTNRALVTLPSTGANTALWIMLLGLAVVGIGFVYLKKSRKEEMTQ